MTESQTYSPSRRKYSTAFSMFLHMLLMLTLLSLLAWMIILSWSVGLMIKSNQFSIEQTTGLLVKNNYDFIVKFRPVYTNQLLLEIDHLQTVAQVLVNTTFIWIKQAAAKIHHKKLNLINPSILMNLLFGTIKIILLRLFTFVINVPFMFSIVFIAIVDGLGQRDVRKFQGARESAFLFHRIKPLSSKLFYLLFLFYLCMPAAINPMTGLYLMTIVFSITVMLTVKHYKKYL